MKQLRFTTTNPKPMMAMVLKSNDYKPLVIPDVVGEFVKDNVKGRTAYIHGQAEDLAGFDIPAFIDGNLAQLDLPIEKQDILMLLPSGEFKCKAEYCDVIGSSDCYLITLISEPSFLNQ